MELIKPIVRVGNSAGVILPREFLHGRAKIEIMERPLNIKKDIFEILDPYLYDVLGIYLVGSYAREEQNEKSDVDMIVITEKTNKKIKKKPYEIILVTKNNVEEELKRNALPILPMLKEAKPILNETLIDKYRETSLTKENLKWHIELTKSALKVNKAGIKLDKLMNSLCSDANAYSLVLRLRGIYLVDCMIKNKLWSTKEFLSLIKKISGSTKAYEGYFRIKNDIISKKEDLPFNEAEKLYLFILKKIKEQEKWAKRKK